MQLQTKDTFKANFVDLPYGDKSMTHRALICCALSDGKCLIKNPAINADTLATIDCLIKLGAKIIITDQNTIEVYPIVKPNTNLVFDCKNSGTTARLLLGVVAGLNVNVKFVGDESLSKRPMQRVILPLTQMGAIIKTSSDCMFEVFPSGKLAGITYQMSVPSAQVKSAILFAGLFANGKTIVKENFSTRNHTETYLKYFGADINFSEGIAEITSLKTLQAKTIEIPNDFSTAAFLLAMGLNDGVVLKNVSLNHTRTAFLQWLQRFGAKVKAEVKNHLCGEPAGEIHVNNGQFKPVYADSLLCNQMIDEIPICCLLSALAVGESKFEGVAELRVKESDRVAQIKDLLTSFGIECKIEQDTLTVCGKGKLVLGKAPNTFDHRIAMLGVVAGVLCGELLPPQNPLCIDVSTPNFLQLIGCKLKLGLFGKGIKNSLSPKLYESFAKATGVNIDYKIFDVEEENFSAEFKNAYQNLNGANLTVPYKTKLTMQLAPTNTLKRVGEQTLFFNTDGYGLAKALKQHEIDPYQKNLLVLGCGGAGTEAIRVLTSMGAKVWVRNRTKFKIEEIAKLYPIQTEAPECFDGILSFMPPTQRLTLVSPAEIANTKFIFDACYTSKTAFTQQAIEMKKLVVDGKSMLFWQGVKNFEIWTGIRLTNKQIDFAKDDFFNGSD